MNYVTRIIRSVFTPSAFNEKKAPRSGVQNRFAAAGLSNLTADWVTVPQHIQQVLRANLKPLRARSREQAMNNSYARRFIALAKSNIVGPKGVSIQSQVQRIDGKGLDSAANKAIEQSFNDWSRDHCDVSGRLSFLDIQKLFVSTHCTDGEFIAIEHWNVGEHGYQLEVMDAEQLDIHLVKTLSNGNRIRLGIEYTPANKPVNYYFRTLDENGGYYGHQHRVIPAERVIHCFLNEWPGQDRGIPWFSTALLRMKMLDGYEDAAVVAARVGAQKMGFISTETGDSYTGDDEDEDGNIIVDGEPGSFEQIPAGTEITAYDPKYPHEQFDQFTKRILRGIGAGCGVGYEPLANDREGVNYSSLRSGALDDRDLWMQLQEYIIDKAIRRIRNNWFTAAYLKGVIRINGVQLGFNSKGKATTRTVQDYLPATYQGKRWKWVDPQKEMIANEKAIDARITSISQIIRDQGGDPDQVFADIKLEREKMRKAGILPEPKTPANAGVSVNEVVEDD